MGELREKIAENILNNFVKENCGYEIIENVATKDLQIGDYTAIIPGIYNDIKPILTEIGLIVFGEEYAVINDVWCFGYDELNRIARKK